MSEHAAERPERRDPDRRGRVRLAAIWALLAAALLATVIIGHRPEQGGLPLDPNSPAPDGTKGLVEVLRELGAQVRVSSAPPAAPPAPAAEGASTALLLSDDLDDQGRARLTSWVREGGTLVVADPDSTITDLPQAGAALVGVIGSTLGRDCDLPALRDVGQVAPAEAIFFTVPAGARGCFTDGKSKGRGAWLVVQPRGAGTVVRLGGADALVNANLGKADNGLLAASLLAPAAGTRVTVLQPPLPGGGRRGLTDLIAPRVKLALWQLVVAFVVLVLWRARRLGQPVAEPQLVRLPGSDLVVAVGNLLQRARKRRQAADLLAADLRRTLGERLGLPASIPPEQLAAAVAARTGMLPERVLAAVAPAPPHDEAELVALAQAVDSIRREVTREVTGAGAS